MPTVNRPLQTLLVVCISAVTCASGPASEVSNSTPAEWEVTHVIDGDTIRVSGLGTVRLLGIDAPESVHPRLQVQPCGMDAAVRLHQVAYRRRVRIEVSGTAARDRYGRLLATVWGSDGRGLPTNDINLLMVREGLARVETRWYFPRKQQYLQTQSNARAARRGIWGKQCQ